MEMEVQMDTETEVIIMLISRHEMAGFMHVQR